VQVVSAWRWDGFEEPPAATNLTDGRDRAEQMLAREIASLGDRGGVSVSSTVVEGRAADVLSAAARDADLLVLGSHGHSRVRHTVLGSVSEECVTKATCPIVVLPVPAAAPKPSAEPAVRA
jgi:nucleotide-binding universal stress UspA family protein